ncbi:hypothetical protein [Siccibacter turicensis]|uniref:hypothetical protein n=1 Tax=Siccibacter turicensis TaxID=357233 RepID=UPI0023F4D92B|nr:hypothetical protein [Siccibacter turicensis]
MKSIPSTLALCAAAFVFSSHADASGGGVVHFRGSIVEAPCEVTQAATASRVQVSCFQHGNVTEQTIPLSMLKTHPVKSDAPVAMDVHYLNPQKTLAVVTLRYN